jgi:MerR family transcriptional regulator, thiopeptide resistance regulator
MVREGGGVGRVSSVARRAAGTAAITVAANLASTPSQRRPLTVTQLARQFGLARSTLLYYDRIGLLRPARHSPVGYRLYDAQAIERLKRIVELRSAGMALTTIKLVLETSTPLADALERQVSLLNRQLAQLRDQQRVVLTLLQSRPAARRARTMTKESWTRMFRSIGLTDEDMRQWHVHFERTMPEAHRDFLESLGLDAPEVRRIRAWSGSSSKA